jgi:hypothetical protein
MKPTIKWVLYTHDGQGLVILSKKFGTKEDAEKLRSQYPERERRTIGVGRSL